MNNDSIKENFAVDNNDENDLENDFDRHDQNHYTHVFPANNFDVVYQNGYMYINVPICGYYDKNFDGDEYDIHEYENRPL